MVNELFNENFMLVSVYCSFVFASEIKALFTFPFVPRNLNEIHEIDPKDELQIREFIDHSW